LIKEH
jgi:hypothetical protein